MSGIAILLRSAAVLVVGLLAACGPPMAWQKPGVTMAQAQFDSQECAGLARNQAFRESYFGPHGYYGYPAYPYGPTRYGYYGYRGYDPYMWRGQRESDLQDFCLRARGYHLAPVPQ